jgi:hypothetical protein
VLMVMGHGGSFCGLFCGFDLSILQGFYIGLVQNMRFWYLKKTRWKKTFQLLSVS